MKTTSRITTTLLAALAMAALTSACASETDQLTARRGPDDGSGQTGGNGTGTGENGPIECTAKPTGRQYKGFDGDSLTAARVNENVGINRARIKPFRSLEGEYKRVLGAAPAGLASQAESFDSQDPRWFEEPQASGVGLSTLYNLAFEGALTYAKSQASLSTAPTADSAKQECSAFMRKAWSRTPTTEEIDQCVTFATTGVSKETDAARKWAYAFASVLTSTRFITY